MTTPALQKPVIIHSQLGPVVDAIVATHWSRPIVRAETATDLPWAPADDVDLLLARPFTKWPDAPTEKPSTWPGSLKGVISGSTGVDQFPRWIFEGPQLSCGRGVNAGPIAEFVLGSILRHAKRFDAIRMRGPADFRRIELGTIDGQTLGLAGFGALGQAIAPIAAVFGMQVKAFKRTPWTHVPEGVQPVASIEDLFSGSDHVVLALPSTPETRGIVNAAVLARSKPGLHLINIARGALLDQDALLAALDAGQLAAATLDVTEPEPLAKGHPLYAHPRILVTPHVSWQARTNGERLAAKILDALDYFARGEPMPDLVDPARGY